MCHEPVHYIYVEFYILDYLEKNTIISNFRLRMFPKFTYILYNLMLFRTVYVSTFQTGFKLKSKLRTLTLNASTLYIRGETYTIYTWRDVHYIYVERRTLYIRGVLYFRLAWIKNAIHYKFTYMIVELGYGFLIISINCIRF